MESAARERRPCGERLGEHVARSGRVAAAAWLSGSRAGQTARPDSDVDVALLLGTGRPTTLAGLPLSLEGELEREWGHPVQVVVLDGAPLPRCP